MFDFAPGRRNALRRPQPMSRPPRRRQSPRDRPGWRAGNWIPGRRPPAAAGYARTPTPCWSPPRKATRGLLLEPDLRARVRRSGRRRSHAQDALSARPAAFSAARRTNCSPAAAPAAGRGRAAARGWPRPCCCLVHGNPAAAAAGRGALLRRGDGGGRRCAGSVCRRMALRHGRRGHAPWTSAAGRAARLIVTRHELPLHLGQPGRGGELAVVEQPGLAGGGWWNRGRPGHASSPWQRVNSTFAWKSLDTIPALSFSTKRGAYYSGEWTIAYANADRNARDQDRQDSPRTKSSSRPASHPKILENMRLPVPWQVKQRCACSIRAWCSPRFEVVLPKGEVYELDWASRFGEPRRFAVQGAHPDRQERFACRLRASPARRRLLGDRGRARVRRPQPPAAGHRREARAQHRRRRSRSCSAAAATT